MHILALSHYYPPEVNAPASRLSEHARAWVAAGHKVTVVTSAPNHPNGVLYPGYSNRFFHKEMVEGVEVVRVWTWLTPNKGRVRRTINHLSYMVSALFALMRLPKPDVVLSTSPQFFCGLAGLGAKWFYRKPWVFEVRDLWPESIISLGMMKKGFALRFIEWLEQLAYRKADRVVSVTDSFVPHIAERRGKADVAVIKNGVDLSFFSRSEDGEDVKRQFGFEGRTVVAYVGTHGMAHGLESVLDAAALLANDPEVGFLFVGDGAKRPSLVARAKAMGLTNVHIAGQLPKADMPKIWSATDISLIVLRRTDTFKMVLPSKMFEAMAMKCPIILGVEGEAQALLEEAGGGIAVEPENTAALADAVRQLADRSRRQKYGEQGYAFVNQNFDRRKLAQDYLNLFSEILR